MKKQLILTVIFVMTSVCLFAQDFKKGDIYISGSAGYYGGQLFGYRENVKGGFSAALEMDAFLGKSWSLSPQFMRGEYTSSGIREYGTFTESLKDYNMGMLVKKHFSLGSRHSISVGTGFMFVVFVRNSKTYLNTGVPVIPDNNTSLELGIPLQFEYNYAISPKIGIGVRASSFISTGPSATPQGFSLMPKLKVKL